MASRGNGILAVAAWDLDECERRGTWWLCRPDASTVPVEVLNLLRAQDRGTDVVWQRLDRLVAAGGADPRHALVDTKEQRSRFLASRVQPRFYSVPCPVGQVGRALPPPGRWEDTIAARTLLGSI